jgi:hypothetical protein
MGWPGINNGLRGEMLTANHRCHGIGFYEYLTTQYAFSVQSSSNIRNNISFWKVSTDVVVNSSTAFFWVITQRVVVIYYRRSGFLALEDGTDRLSRNVCKKFPELAA